MKEVRWCIFCGMPFEEMADSEWFCCPDCRKEKIRCGRMKCVPHEYQREACNRIINQERCGLFLDMGLGKTLITLTAINWLIHKGIILKALIIAPLRVAQVTWTEEAEKWEHINLTFSKVLGTAKQRETALSAKADCYIINRENVPWLCDFAGKKWDFDMLVIDELSSFKSHSSERFKKLKKYAPLCKRVVGLTGTPTSNGLIDLWSQIFLLDQGERLQKKFTWFRDLYFEPDKYFGQHIRTYKARYDAEERIAGRLSDLCYSMQAKDYLTLPERQDIIHYVEFPPKLMKRYEDFQRNSFIEFETGEATALSGAALINKLLQFSNGAVYINEPVPPILITEQYPQSFSLCENASPLKWCILGDTISQGGKWEGVHRLKLDALGEILEFAKSPVLCFYSYKHDLERIQREFSEAVKLETAEDIAKWNRGEIPLLLCHPASAGHGLNLQAGGHIIVWFGLPWSLELYQQANARLYRQGQKHFVSIYHIMAKETADLRVYRSLKDKTDIQNDIIKWLKENE